MGKAFTKLFIPIVILVISVGCGMTENDSFKDESILKMKKSAEEYIFNNYEGIKKVEVEEPFRNEMGAIKVEGLVNGRYKFRVTVNEDFTISGISKSEGFPDRKE